MTRTWSEVRAEHPPTDQHAYDQAYSEAGVALQLAEITYGMRVTAGMSQTELAEALDISPDDVEHLEEGGVVPTLDTLYQLMEATGVGLEVHFGNMSINLGRSAAGKRPEFA